MNNMSGQMFMPNNAENQPSGSSERQIAIPGNTPVNLENVSDFSNVCRTCATITEFVIPIFSGEGLQNKLADKIHKHLPIGVSESDVLPRVVCYQCASTLLAWHELVKCCVQADQALRAKVAADTRTESATKVQKPTSQPSQRPLLAIEDNPQNKFKEITEYVVGNMAPPAYVPTRRCDFCPSRHPDADFQDHVINEHSSIAFLCEECDTFIHKREFMAHMSRHADAYTNNPELVERLKERSASDVNQNIETKKPKTEPAPTEERKPPKTNDQHDFSDHSDTEDGFGPLPDSVFTAIEDSQDSQSVATRRSAAVERPHASTSNSNTPNEDSTSKSLRNRSRTCPVCAKVYTASSSYFYHMKYTHGQVKDHGCQYCEKKFATRGSLRIHLATHTDEYQYECKDCGKHFKSTAGLYIHQQTHSGIMCWTCSECPMNFRWRTHLERHMKRHTGEKPYICAVCGRGFTIHCDLLRHARTHNAGNFECDHCGGKFAQLRYLKVHMEKKHSTKDNTKGKKC